MIINKLTQIMKKPVIKYSVFILTSLLAAFFAEVLMLKILSLWLFSMSWLRVGLIFVWFLFVWLLLFPPTSLIRRLSIVFLFAISVILLPMTIPLRSSQASQGALVEFQNPNIWLLFGCFVAGAAIIAIFYEKLYRPRIVVPILCITSFLLFYSYSVVIFHDSAHYLAYLPIIDGNGPIEAWDIIRGPTYPLFLWVVTRVIGISMNIMLIVHYTLYVATLYLYYKIALHFLPVESNTHKLHLLIALYILIGLNPLFFGYFHLMLTEFLATFSVALILYAAIILYKCGVQDNLNVKYRLSQVVLVSSFPILYFLKQSYLMIAVCTLLALVFLMLVQRAGIKKILRPIRLTLYALTALAIGLFTWNAILPEPPVSMENRGSDRYMRGIFIGSTEYMKYRTGIGFLESLDEDERYEGLLSDDEIDYLRNSEVKNWVIVFQDSAGNIVDTHTFYNVDNIGAGRAIGIFLANFFRQPGLVIRGIVDSYLASINFYKVIVMDWGYRYERNIGLFREFENRSIGLSTFLSGETHTNIFLGPHYWEIAGPFENKRTAGPPIDDIFMRMRIAGNLTFTVGFLLLPFTLLSSAILVMIRRKSIPLVVAFISSAASFGYILLDSMSQFYLDRYNFPIYIATWIAIAALTYGIIDIQRDRKTRTSSGAAHGIS